MAQPTSEARSSSHAYIRRLEHQVQIVGSCPVGIGGSSYVSQGELTHNKSAVAVKFLHAVKHGEGLSVYEREARIWSFLQHPNVCPFYGIRNVDGQPALIAPWYRNGTANAYLKSKPRVNPKNIIHGITQGVAYLHSRGIVHGDIKGDNIMIDDDGHSKIIDFGQSHVLTPDFPGPCVGSAKSAYSIRWSAPELIEYSDPTYASDVYSLACTILELMTGDVPYAGLNSFDVYLNKQEPPSLFADAFKYDVKDAKSLCELLDLCWGPENTRPGILDMQDQLRRML